MKRLAVLVSSSTVLLLSSQLLAQAVDATAPAAPEDWTAHLGRNAAIGAACGLVAGIVVYMLKKPKDGAKK